MFQLADLRRVLTVLLLLLGRISQSEKRRMTAMLFGARDRPGNEIGRH
jgi:hypothetical protein